MQVGSPWPVAQVVWDEGNERVLERGAGAQARESSCLMYRSAYIGTLLLRAGCGEHHCVFYKQNEHVGCQLSG
jgi:hypothetical protein